jgi:hypothetical protein
MNRNITIAAAVAAALASGAALAAGPSIATINSTAGLGHSNTINIMGSSAIKNALTNAILTNFCGGAGNATVVTSNGTNGNFLGIACTPVAGATNSGNYNVWVRFEGGSVVGYLPLVNTGFPLNEIDGAALTANPITVNGTSATNGTTDSFTVSAGGGLTRVIPDLGIGDVEPAALINNNYPTDYCTAVFGPNASSGLGSLKSNGIIDEVYALYVNENSTIFTENPLNLSREMIANILTHVVTNWSQVYDYNLNPVTNGALAINLVNREFGSGSRATADILMAGDSCGSGGVPTTLFNKASATRYFATGDVLKAANSVPGAITYASIDNAPGGTGNQSNLSWVTVEGVVPGNLAAASGTYPFWVEAQYVNNAANTGADSAAVNFIVSALQNEQTTAALADVDAIPNVVNATGSPAQLNTTVHINPANSAVVPSGGGTATVYINPFTRAGHTCNNPQYSANQLP